MALAARPRITVVEYDALTRDDPRCTELIDGEIVVSEPRLPHGLLQASLIAALAAWSAAAPGRPRVSGPTEVRLTRFDSYGPDLVVVPAAPRLTARETLADVPLICVEIRSPSTWHHDVGRKKTVYERAGVPELWLVDGAAEVVLVYRRSAAGAATFDMSLELTAAETLASPQLPGFELPLAGLFI